MKTILYVPTKNDPRKVLAQGAWCVETSNPTRMGLIVSGLDGKGWHIGWENNGGFSYVLREEREDSPFALPLVWNGEAVPEGCDRAARTIAKILGRCTLEAEYTPRLALMLADTLACEAGGKVVVIEKDGRTS